MKTIAGREQEKVIPRIWPRPRTAGLVVRFEEGLIGFSDYKDFVLLENQEMNPFYVLQSITNREVGFVVIDPVLIMNDYYDSLPPRSCDMVDLEDASVLTALVICSIGATSRETTANLLGPLIVNSQKRVGRQIILTDSRLSVRHSLL